MVGYQPLHQKEKKKKKKKWIVAAAVLLLLALFWYFENFTLSVTHTRLSSEKISEPFTFVLLSDLHGYCFGRDNSRLLAAIEEADPDFVAVVGDMYTSGDSGGRQTAIDLLSRIRRPVYFVPGEHDHADAFLAELRAAGVELLDFESASLPLGGNEAHPVTLYGSSSIWFSPGFDLHNAFDPPDPDGFSILLAHIPQVNAYENFGVDLILSGDTHGGMIQLPLIGPVHYNGVWFPRLTQPDIPVYDRGLFTLENGQHLYVTAGLGNYPLPMRLFNRPEVAVITVLPA